MRLAEELTPSAPILRNETFSPKIAPLAFLHPRPVLLISVVANSHLVRDLECKTKKPTEQWTVICETHTCVLYSGNSESSTLSVSLLSQPFQHDRWPCDHPQVVFVETLPLPHMRESPHLGVLSCLVHYRISK